MSELEVQTDLGGNVVKSKLSVTAEGLLKAFSERCGDTMWAITEEAIRSVMPEGANIASWTRKHGVHIGIDELPNKVRHRVFKDGDLVAEVFYKNGTVYSKIHMGRGELMDYEPNSQGR
jgi:hypothetical protein